MPKKPKNLREIMRELEPFIAQLHSEGMSQDRINDIVLKVVKRRIERMTPNPKPKPRIGVLNPWVMFLNGQGRNKR